MEKILVISNNKDNMLFLREILEARNFDVSTAGFELALASLARTTYSLILVDVAVGGQRGPELIMALQTKTQAPILCLVSPGAGLETLLDCAPAIHDFLFRPVRTDEIEFRIRRLLSALPFNGQEPSKAGYPANGDEPAPVAPLFRIDDFGKQIYFKGTPLNLTLREFTLLRALAKHPGRVFSNEEILAAVWSKSPRASASDVQQYIHRLRKKLEESAQQPAMIVTIKGFGYRLQMAQSER